MTDDEQWQTLVDAVGGQLPGLVEKFLTRILPDPAYAESGLTLEDLRGSSLRSFSAMLSALGGRAPDIGALSVYASELGARRARQGVPLTAWCGRFGSTSPYCGMLCPHRSCTQIRPCW